MSFHISIEIGNLFYLQIAVDFRVVEKYKLFHLLSKNY